MSFISINGDEAFWVPNHLLDASHEIFPIQIETRTNTPPGSPEMFAAYLVTATATGAWEGYEDHIAISVCDKTSGERTWVFIPPQPGHVVWPLDETEAWIYDGTNWITHAVHIANNHDLDDIRDVTITNVAQYNLLWWDDFEWVNVTPATMANEIYLDNLGDVVLPSPSQYDLIWWDGNNWVNVTPCTMLAQAQLNCLGDVNTAGVTQYNLLWFDGSNWVDVTPCAMLAQAQLSCLGDVDDGAVPTSGHVLMGNGTTWDNARLDCGDVDNASTASGATVCDALSGHESRIDTAETNITNINTTINNLGSDDVGNSSAVSGATVTDALNTLNGTVGSVGGLVFGALTGANPSGPGWTALGNMASGYTVTLTGCSTTDIGVVATESFEAGMNPPGDTHSVVIGLTYGVTAGTFSVAAYATGPTAWIDKISFIATW